MKVKINKRFLKDLSNLPPTTKKQIELFAFEELEKAKDFYQLGFEKLKGYSAYYKKRFGNYRIGAKYSDNVLILYRILHRKDIYKFFP